MNFWTRNFKKNVRAATRLKPLMYVVTITTMTSMTMMTRVNTRLRSAQTTMRCEIRCAYRINFFSNPTALDRCWDSRWSVYTAAAKIAQIRRVDQHNQRYLRRMYYDRGRVQQKRDTWIFAETVPSGYKISDANHLPADHRTEHCRFNDMLTRTNCSIFEEKRSPLDCTYDGDSDNVSVRCSCWMERTQRDNTFFTLRPTSQLTFAHSAASERRSSACRTLHFKNLWDSRCATFEMTDILNIKDGSSTIVKKLRLTRTIRSPTQRSGTATK